MALTKGSKAPDFTLKQKTSDGLKEISLADTLGEKSTVLLFFPFAFTSVCQEELCSVSGGFEAYDKLNAVVYGISGDSPFAQEAFAKANKITVPLLADYNHDVAKAYDVAYGDLLGFSGVAKRSAFVISPEGLVTYVWSSDDPHDLPPFQEIQAALKA